MPVTAPSQPHLRFTLMTKCDSLAGWVICTLSSAFFLPATFMATALSAYFGIKSSHTPAGKHIPPAGGREGDMSDYPLDFARKGKGQVQAKKCCNSGNFWPWASCRHPLQCSSLASSLFNSYWKHVTSDPVLSQWNFFPRCALGGFLTTQSHYSPPL